MKGIAVLKYQVEYPRLNKKTFETMLDMCEIAIINIRLDELQTKMAYMVKRNKPTRSGMKITFAPVKDMDQYAKELCRIIQDGEALGMKFEMKEGSLF